MNATGTVTPTVTPEFSESVSTKPVTDELRPSELYSPVKSTEAPLRIGLLVDGEQVPAWVARIVAQIEASEFARVTLVVVNDEPPRRLSLLARLRARLQHILYHLYARHDSTRRRGPDSAFHLRDLQPLLEDARWITVKPKRSGYVHRINASDLEGIRAEQPDLLLRFGFNILRGEILKVARHGMWSYHHDDSAEYRGGPAMFWEIHENNPLTGTVLQQLSETLDAGGVLYRSHAATNPLSLEQNRNPAYWKASSFVMRCLRQLAANGVVPAAAPEVCNKPLYRNPSNTQMLQFIARIGVRKTRALIEHRLRVPHWFVAWRHTPQPLDPATPRLTGMRELPCPKGHFYADPLLHSHNGQPWLLLEDFDYARGKANLAAIPWSVDGPAGQARTILDLDVHLSYPFVFEWRGDTWLIPESAAARRISLFRARAFPDRWEFVCDLLKGYRFVDATLHEHAGRWYLFANVCEAGGGTYDELFLFHADTPLGPFLPHPCNPIVSDVRRARPAGRLFQHDGRLIRPAQDCALGYGNALVFNAVRELSPVSYREQQIGRLAPDWARIASKSPSIRTMRPRFAW